jgi:esterase FrsA
MPYQWPLDASELFGERYPQMINTGLPACDVDAVRAAVTEMWADAPGGWVHEWSKLAATYADAGAHEQAALAYGWAKFPTLADESKRVALAKQLEQYRLAAPGFGVRFERYVLELPYRGDTTSVPVHLLAPFDLAADRRRRRGDGHRADRARPVVGQRRGRAHGHLDGRIFLGPVGSRR